MTQKEIAAKKMASDLYSFRGEELGLENYYFDVFMRAYMDKLMPGLHDWFDSIYSNQANLFNNYEYCTVRKDWSDSEDANRKSLFIQLTNVKQNYIIIQESDLKNGKLRYHIREVWGKSYLDEVPLVEFKPDYKWYFDNDFNVDIAYKHAGIELSECSSQIDYVLSAETELTPQVEPIWIIESVTETFHLVKSIANMLSFVSSELNTLSEKV